MIAIPPLFNINLQATNLVRSEPLSQRQVLISLENLYDLVLKVEQLRRDQPLPEDEEIFMEWYALSWLSLYAVFTVLCLQANGV